jgi:hypothetical protein
MVRATVALSIIMGSLVLTDGVSHAATSPSVNVLDAFIIEHGSGKTKAEVWLQLSARQGVDATVTVSTADGTATSPGDYIAETTTVVIPAGQLQWLVEIPRIVADDLVEANETLTVAISNPINAVLGDSTANVVIVDDDVPGAPTPLCDDGNPYTTDAVNASTGLCSFVLRTGADDDHDTSSAAWVGGLDCNDSVAAINQRATEIPADGLDNNCDGLVDGATIRNCSDANPYTQDQYNRNKGWCVHKLLSTADLDGDSFVGAWVGGPDCADSTPGIHPGAPEVADGVDSDCDGLDVPPDPVEPQTGVTTIAGVGEPWNCPPSASCIPVVVNCGGLPSARAYMAVSQPTVAPRGVITMFLGSEGTGFYDAEDEFAPRLLAAGFILARINWSDGWNNTLPNGPFGLSKAACRTATIVEHVRQTEYVPLGLTHPVGVCGFCVTGNSAGALQADYLLAEYGMDDVLDAVVTGGGPIPAMIADACLQADEGSTYGITRPSVVDFAYGTPKGQSGPCAHKDPSYEAVWRADGLVEGGEDFYHPTTRVSILIGGLDHTSAPNHALAYRDRLLAEGSPFVSYQIIPTAGHGLSKFLPDPAAQDALVAELTWQP